MHVLGILSIIEAYSIEIRCVTHDKFTICIFMVTVAWSLTDICCWFLQSFIFDTWAWPQMTHFKLCAVESSLPLHNPRILCKPTFRYLAHNSPPLIWYYFFITYFNIIVPSTSRSSKWTLSFKFPRQIPIIPPSSPTSPDGLNLFHPCLIRIMHFLVMKCSSLSLLHRC